MSKPPRLLSLQSLLLPGIPTVGSYTAPAQPCRALPPGCSGNALPSPANLDEARNATLMKDMRRNMLNGVWSEECGRCRSEEESGLNSRRIYEQQQWDYTQENARNDTNLDGSINVEQVPVKYYDLRFGNFCNLKCRMCGLFQPLEVMCLDGLGPPFEIRERVSMGREHLFDTWELANPIQ